jgi:hypothetical protein
LNGTLIWWKKIELRHSLSCWLAGEEKRNNGEAQKSGNVGKKIRLLLTLGIFLHFSCRLFYDFVPKISHF